MDGQLAAQPPLFSIHFPRRVSRKDFNRHIAPHLMKPQKGPKPKLSRYKLFNYILLIYHTGIRWRELKTRRYKFHWRNIRKWHKRWSQDGSYNRLLGASLLDLLNRAQLDADVSGTQSWLSSWGLCLKRQPPALSGRVGRSPRVRGSSRHTIKMRPAAKTAKLQAVAKEMERELAHFAALCRGNGANHAIISFVPGRTKVDKGVKP